MYVCGITAYDHCHIGHARSFLAFDTIIRFFQLKKYKIIFVRNITDIDDKIINKSQSEKIGIKEITNQYISSMKKDVESLNLISPSYEPKATDYIPHMLKFISKLIDKGFAYKSINGDIYYKVDKFKKYGELSCNKITDLKQLDNNQKKDKFHDFALWKKSKKNEPRWESPWGSGRPGWHLECSVMSMEILGGKF